jgi:catechol 2,3-dioxygenase-like lactoylglutathione lyase family enzyme
MRAQTAFGLSRIGQIAVRVKQIDRAVAFYRDTLGVPFLFNVPTMAFFQCGEISLMLDIPEDKEFDHPSSLLYFSVEDIDDAYRTLTDRGVEFLSEPHIVHRASDFELWMAFFRDPDHNTLALMSRKPRV